MIHADESCLCVCKNTAWDMTLVNVHLEPLLKGKLAIFPVLDFVCEPKIFYFNIVIGRSARKCKEVTIICFKITSSRYILQICEVTYAFCGRFPLSHYFTLTHRLLRRHLLAFVNCICYTQQLKE